VGINLGKLASNVVKDVKGSVSGSVHAVEHAAQKATSAVASSNVLTDTFETISKATSAAGHFGATLFDKHPPATVPAPPSKGNTITSSPVSDADKVARGALKVDNKADPKTYDGMYLGADGYAYPPSQFKSSEVPPFTPAAGKATAVSYFTNGIGSQVSEAVKEAHQMADLSGTNVVPIYNATEGAISDIVQTAEDRADLGNDKAANTLADAVQADLAAGKNVNVIAYSQGGAIASHALEMLNDRLPGSGDQKAQTLGHVNLVGLASAGKNFPKGPQYTFYTNQSDPVPNWLGVHEFNPVTDFVNGVVGAIPGLNVLNGGGAGYDAPGAKLYTFDDGNQPHGLGTYVNHINAASVG